MSGNVKNLKIPPEFMDENFANFLMNTFPLKEPKDLIRLTGWGSVQEYADFFTLNIELDTILELLRKNGCIKKTSRKENLLQYKPLEIEILRLEILERLGIPTTKN